MTLEELKDFLDVAESISKRIDLEGKLYDEILEDNYGLPKGLCLALDALVDTMDKHCGGDAISWYIFENNYGINKLSVTIDGEEVVIDSVEKLYEMTLKDANG